MSFYENFAFIFLVFGLTFRSLIFWYLAFQFFGLIFRAFSFSAFCDFGLPNRDQNRLCVFHKDQSIFALMWSRPNRIWMLIFQVLYGGLYLFYMIFDSHENCRNCVIVVLPLRGSVWKTETQKPKDWKDRKIKAEFLFKKNWKGRMVQKAEICFGLSKIESFFTHFYGHIFGLISNSVFQNFGLLKIRPYDFRP